MDGVTGQQKTEAGPSSFTPAVSNTPAVMIVMPSDSTAITEVTATIGLETASVEQTQPFPQDESTWLAGSTLLIVLLSVLLILASVVVFILRMRRRGKRSAVRGLKVSNIHHIGMREEQQDAFGVSDIIKAQQTQGNGILAVVADGMGGMENGAEISRLVTGSMLAYFPVLASDIPPREQLLHLLIKANGDLKQQRLSNKNDQGGTTVVAAIIREGFLQFASVGDSRIYLWRNGAFILLNREHTYASELEIKAVNGKISFTEAQNDPQKKALTSYLGMQEITAIDINPQPIALEEDDVVVLMTDGVFNALEDDEIAALITERIYDSAQKIEQAVIHKNSQNQDNFTAVFMRICGRRNK